MPFLGALSSESSDNNGSERVGEANTYMFWWRYTLVPALQKQYAVSPKIKIELLHDPATPLPSMYPLPELSLSISNRYLNVYIHWDIESTIMPMDG